jgi:hypothetical protein
MGPVGLLLWGCGLGRRLAPMVAIAGTGITYGVLCAATTTSMVYIIDCYRPIAGEAVMILVAFRNIFAFGFSFAVVPWVTSDGFIKVSHCLSYVDCANENRLLATWSSLKDSSFSWPCRCTSLDHGSVSGRARWTSRSLPYVAPFLASPQKHPFSTMKGSKIQPAAHSRQYIYLYLPS